MPETMHNSHSSREHDVARTFFGALLDRLPVERPSNLVLLTHLLPDRPPLLEAYSAIGAVKAVIPVEYSLDPAVRRQALTAGVPITDWAATPNAPNYFSKTLRSVLADDHLPLIVSDIGGWFAPAAAEMAQEYGARLSGVVEDTEVGHRTYAGMDLDFPVVSVARSPLKEAEDHLAGQSVVYSVERIVRRLGRPLTGLRVLVIGFGKIGSGAAGAAAARGASVSVYDNRADRRALAMASGYRIPPRYTAISTADVIIGCTGNHSLHDGDLANVTEGAVIASGSSKRLEFDFAELDALPPDKPEEIRVLRVGDGKSVYVLADGRPVNFLDDAVIGAALRLVQGGLLAATATMTWDPRPPGMSELDSALCHTVSDLWIEHYVASDGLLK